MGQVYKSGGGGGGFKMELLWKNASPDSAFLKQLLALELSEYTHVGISAKWAPGANQTDDGIKIYRIDETPKSIDSQAAGVPAATGRTFSFVSTGIRFQSAWANGVNNDGYIIPLEIYGIKGVRL